MTRTEELRDRMTKLIFKHKFPNLDWESYVDTMVEKQQCTILATQILQACEEVGLAFMVKGAELPRNLWQGDFGYGYAQGRQDMLKAGYRQTKEIDTREPR